MLNTSIAKIKQLTRPERRLMFRLYAYYYDGADQRIFQRDLDGKDYVVLLKDELGIIRGFSTLALYTFMRDGKAIRVLYSGDTIIEKRFWGENQFSKAWLELAGCLKAEAPELPLYWLLIVKGHRTYRYLSLFSREYYPRHDAATPHDFQELMHYLARQKFGDWYDAATGLVRFPEPRSFLNSELAAIPDKDCWRAEVKYFVERNPRYHEGDELLCLCELKAENLTRFARQWFQQGSAQRLA